MNAGDIEGSLAYFADDAVAYIIGLPPTGMEVYAGKEQIRALWQDSVDNHFQWETEITSANGDIVMVRAKTWHDFTRQLEVAPLEYVDVYEVKDGKITTYGTTITAGALAEFMPAFEEVVPPEDPVPSTEEPVSEMTVTIAGGTCAIDHPAPFQAGEIKVTLNIKDQDKDLYALTLFNLEEGKDLLDLMASTAGIPPSWADILLMEELEPGKNATYTFTVEKGPVYLICWSKPPDLPIGNAGPIEVRE
jgi:ketosteroid isomerase-like protein